MDSLSSTSWNCDIITYPQQIYENSSSFAAQVNIYSSRRCGLLVYYYCVQIVVLRLLPHWSIRDVERRRWVYMYLWWLSLFVHPSLGEYRCRSGSQKDIQKRVRQGHWIRYKFAMSTLTTAGSIVRVRIFCKGEEVVARMMVILVVGDSIFPHDAGMCVRVCVLTYMRV